MRGHSGGNDALPRLHRRRKGPSGGAHRPSESPLWIRTCVHGSTAPGGNTDVLPLGTASSGTTRSPAASEDRTDTAFDSCAHARRTGMTAPRDSASVPSPITESESFSNESLLSWARAESESLVRKTEDFVKRVFDPYRRRARSASTEFAVLAIGGFGRGELTPFSDIDLLILSDGTLDLSPAVNALWDSGRRPSPLFRTWQDLSREGIPDLHLATSLLSGRFLLGNPPSWREELVPMIRRSLPDFEKKLLAETRNRWREKAGRGFQQPDIRDGRGGLRDIQTWNWLHIVTGSPKPPEELKPLYDLLFAVRFLLHTVKPRLDNRFLLVDWSLLAERYPSLDPERLAHQVGRTLKEVSKLWEEVLEPSPLPERITLPRSRREFFSYALTEKPFSFPSLLRFLDQKSFLSEFLPEWSLLEGLVRNDPIHLFTVDEHILRAVEKAERLLKNPPAFLAKLPFPDSRDLLLAVLFHDFGKGRGKDHALESVRIAEELLPPDIVSRSRRQDLLFGIRNHMLLSLNAFRRNIDDPLLISRVAHEIGSLRRLSLLAYLTLADLHAVSPQMLTDWKMSLLERFVRRLARQCRTFLPPEDLARKVIEKRKDRVRRLISPEKVSALQRHFAMIDATYAFRFTPEHIARHLELIERAEKSGLAVDIEDFPDAGYTEFTVVTPSHEGLFCEIVAALTGRNLDILEATITTRTDDIAIDTFRVCNDRGEAVCDSARWQAVIKDLEQVFTGTIFLDELVRTRLSYARSNLPRKKGRKEEYHCRFDSPPDSPFIIVEVIGPDQPGVLYSIARAFRDCNISVSSAIVSTWEGFVVDVFYVARTPFENLGERKVEEILLESISRHV
ncbi:MAG: HD domain-containing protein [Candidatus Hydrogenedentota bacterium]|nr:MAG: HD domain-containing protein [Candidatus Hydrogenedentota bacterium]